MKICEGTKESNELLKAFEDVLFVVAEWYVIEYKTPPHDISRRLLNEVEGFEPIEE